MKSFLALLIPILFLALVGFTAVYLSRRFGFFFGAESYTWFYWFFSLLIVGVLFGSISMTMATSTIGHLVYMLAGLLLGYITYLLFSTLLIDLAGLFVKIKPLYMGYLSLGLALIVTLYGFANARNVKLTSVDIPVQGLEKPVKAMHLTDIHLGHYRGKKFFDKVINLTKEQNPEVIFFTGDLFDATFALKEDVIASLRSLEVPFYFVEGNHDLYTGVRRIKDMVRRHGGVVLENEVTTWNDVQIIGLNHMLADNQAFDMHASDENGNTVKSVLERLDIDPGKPAVLLHHSPDGDQYAKKAGVDLYLAGHTHGWQMFPATLFARALFKYNRGLHHFEGMPIYVCLGAGTFGPPLRVGTFSEVTIINLVPQSTEQ